MHNELDNDDTTPSSQGEPDDNLFPRPDQSPKSARFKKILRRRPTCIGGEDKSKRILKEQIEEQRQTIDGLRHKLQDTLQERKDLRNSLTTTVKEHKYYVGNLQVGDGNTMIAGADNADMFEAIGQVQSLIEQLTKALESDMNKRASLEMDKQNLQIQLMELKQMISNLCHIVKEQAETGHEAGFMADLNSSIEGLQSCLSDEDMIGECLVALKSTADSQCLVDKFESIPSQAQPGITRLVKKFGSSLTWGEFATILGLDQQSINALLQHTVCDSYQEIHRQADELNSHVCAIIMVEWVKNNGADVNKFLPFLEKLQRKIYAALKGTYENDVKGHFRGIGRHRGSLPRRESTESISSITHTESIVTTRTERIQRKDSMHDGGQLKELVDMVKLLVKAIPPNTSTMLEGMTKKLDEIYEDRLNLK